MLPPSRSSMTDSCSKLQFGMPKYRHHRSVPTSVPDDAMLLGEDYHGNQQGAGCVALGLHMSEEDQSDARPRHSANGRLVMDVEMKSDRAAALQQVHMSCVYGSTKAIRCTVPNCSCDCFTPGKPQMRTCDTCKHGWVAHALDKLGFRHLYNCNQVEIVQPNIVFDIASLMLYGCQATPIRLKILLDRLFSVLQHEEVLQVLHGFGWGYEDYARGYILQDSQGNVLDKWTISTRDEEPFILQQFLRFGETKAITQHILLQENSERPDYVVQPTRTDSDIKRFIERTNRVANPFYNRQGDGYIGAKAPHQPVPPSKPLVRIPSAGGSSVHNLSPNGSSQSFGSPVNCTSPLSISPLNRLQNMQPYNYSRERGSPDVRMPLGSSPFQLQAQPPPSQPLQQPQPQPQPQQLHVPSQRLAITNSGLGLHLPSSCTSPTLTLSAATSLPTLGSSIIHSSNSSLLANSDLSASDGGSDDDTSCSALNLSRTATSDSIYATKKVKHLRKSANPMKRRWNPNMLGALVSNSSSGKKRVQCSVCLKTFCDKGALKIHFSAVHLKEMHKCTVEGCNMMFSSRRSRNRHSANPNPKLHSPHLRRKISPHDGRTAHAHPTFFIGTSLPPPSLGQMKLEYHEHQERHGHRSVKHEHHEHHEHRGHRSLKLEHRDLQELRNLQEHRDLQERRDRENPGDFHNHHPEVRNIGPMVSRGPIPLPPPLAESEQRIKTPVERIPTPMDVDRSRSPSPAPPAPAKDPSPRPPSQGPEIPEEVPIELTRPKPQDAPVLKDAPGGEDHGGRSPNKEFPAKENHFPGNDDGFVNKENHYLNKEEHFLNNKGVRKRKSLNPTRCAITDADGIQYVSSDDSSSDTFLQNDSIDNGTDKSDDFKDDDDDDDDDDKDLDDEDDEDDDDDPGIKTSLTSLIAADRIKRERSEGGEVNRFLRKEPLLSSKDIKKSPSQRAEESSETALRHLESLSQGLGKYADLQSSLAEGNESGNHLRKSYSV